MKQERLFEVLEEEQSKLLIKCSGVEGLGRFKETIGITVNRDGITAGEAQRILAAIDLFKKDWNRYKNDETKIVLHEHLFSNLLYSNSSAAGKMVPLRVNSNAMTDLPYPSGILDYNDAYKSQPSLEYEYWARWSEFSIIWVSFVSIACGFLLAGLCSLLFANKLLLGSIWMLSSVAIFGISYIVRKKDARKAYESKVAEKKKLNEVWPEVKWYKVPFMSDDWYIPVSVIYDSFFKEEPTQEALSKLENFAFKMKETPGSLTVLLSSKQNEFDFNPFERRLLIKEGTTVIIEHMCNHSIIIERNSPLTSHITCDEAMKKEIQNLFKMLGPKLFLPYPY